MKAASENMSAAAAKMAGSISVLWRGAKEGVKAASVATESAIEKAWKK